MNFGVVALALLLVCGATVMLFALAGGAPSTSYIDTYGNTNTAQTNTTRVVVIESASPAIIDLAGGGVLLIAVFFVIVLIFIVVKAAGNPHSGYRSGRY